LRCQRLGSPREKKSEFWCVAKNSNLAIGMRNLAIGMYEAYLFVIHRRAADHGDPTAHAVRDFFNF
jgi:hypothetical protein